jgi:cobaltochelatase CobT
MGHFEAQLPSASKISMRHLYLYTHMLIAQANENGRKVRIVWGHISTASIGPDPTIPGGLVMTLPKMAALGTDEDIVLIEGLVSHEIVCHGLHTDFTVPLKPGITGDLCNILEDPRGELLGKPKYPGANQKIHAALRILKAKGVFRGPDLTRETPPAILASWLVTELRSELLKQDCLSEFAKAYRALAVSTFGSDLVGQVKQIALDGCHAKDTQGASDAADRIVALMKLAKDNPAAKPKPNENSNTGSGEGESSPGNTNGQSGNPSPAQGDLSNAIDQILNASSKDLGPFGKGLEEILSASTGAFSKSGGGYQPDNANEMQEQSLSKLGGSIANRTSLRAGAQKTAAMLSLTFEDMIETVTKSETRRTTEGRLNTRSLWRYPLGEEKLFTKTTEGESIDTCFYLLGDESSSMDSKLGPAPGPREPDARITAHEACKRVSVAVGEVLHNLSIPVGIATYNTVVREWHAFDESWAGTLQRFAPTAANGTRTHLAVVWALKKLIDRPEARKILIVATDGDPGNSDVLKAAIAESSSLGIEVRFVLIGDRYKGQYASAGLNFGVALTENELAKAVFSALKQAVA